MSNQQAQDDDPKWRQRQPCVSEEFGLWIRTVGILAPLIIAHPHIARADDCHGSPWTYKEIMGIYRTMTGAVADAPQLGFVGHWTAVRAIIDNPQSVKSSKYFDCDGLVGAGGRLYLTLLFQKSGSKLTVTTKTDGGAEKVQKTTFEDNDNVVGFQQLLGDLRVSYKCAAFGDALFCMQIDNAGGIKGGYNQGYEFQRLCFRGGAGRVNDGYSVSCRTGNRLLR